MQREASLLTNLKDRLDYTEQLLHFTGEEGNIDPASIPQSFQALSLAISDLFGKFERHFIHNGSIRTWL